MEFHIQRADPISDHKLGSARDPTSGTVDSVRQDTAASSGQAAVDVSQAATKRARSRRTVRIQFKGFDDGFDPTTVSKAPKMFDSASQLKVVEEPAMQVWLQSSSCYKLRISLWTMNTRY